MNLENLYGRGRIVKESQIAAKVLEKVATPETCHPADRENWSPVNPTLGHCDVSAELNKWLWGHDLSGKTKWNPEGKFLTYWTYADYEHFLAGLKKNKIDVHYSMLLPKYSEIDHTRKQFTAESFLYPRPKPLTSEGPLTKRWHKDSRVPQRLELLMAVFVPAFLGAINESRINPSPELTIFLKEVS